MAPLRPALVAAHRNPVIRAFYQRLFGFEALLAEVGQMVVDCYATEAAVSMVAGLIGSGRGTFIASRASPTASS